MRTRITGTTIALLALGTLALAQPMMPTLEREVAEHEPTMDDVHKVVDATTNLAELGDEAREKARVDMGMRGRRGGPPTQAKMPTLDEMDKAIRAYPEAVQAIESAGLTPRNYFKNMLSLTFGVMLVTMEKQGMLDMLKKSMPNLTEPKSMDFVRANFDEVQKIMQSMGQRR